MLLIQLNAPAKLNLHLRIGAVRPDGFHEIESLFVALAFGDMLSFETVRDPLKLEISMRWLFNGCTSLQDTIPALSPENNIVFRAVSLFRNRTGYDEGLKITVEKHIPLGGGLGGGSSNAAAALLALNRLASPNGTGCDGSGLLSSATLAEMGASLGSDVPFFLCNADAEGASTAAAWVSGRGEQVQPLVLPESALGLFFILVNPGFPSNTAEAFRLIRCIRNGNRGIGDDSSNYTKVPELNCEKSNNTPCFLADSPQKWPFFNDFLPVFQSIGENGTIYQQIITSLRELGADFAGLSGSGSTCFGVFTEQNRVESAKKALLKRWSFVIQTFLLANRTIQWYNDEHREKGTEKFKEKRHGNNRH